MATYHFEIYARKSGALGILESHAVTVQATDFHAAVSELYKTHEHISIQSWRLGDD